MKRVLSHFFRVCWGCTKWGTLAVLLAAAVAIYIGYHRADDEVRRRVELILAEQYPDLAVHLRAARVVSGQGIILRGLTIRERGADGPQDELLRVDEIHLIFDARLPDLLVEAPHVERIRVIRPTLHMTRRRDRSWSLSRLWPLPSPRGSPPWATIEEGTVEIFDPTTNPTSTWTLRKLQVSLHPLPPNKGATDDPAHPPIRIEGSVSGGHFDRATFEGTVQSDATAWDLDARVENLMLSPALYASLPPEMCVVPTAISEMGGAVDLSFSASGTGRTSHPPEFRIHGRLAAPRLVDPRLPYPLFDVQGRFRFDETGLAIEDVTASNGPAKLALSYVHQNGKFPRLWLKVDELSVNRKLFHALPEEWRQRWLEFLPEGIVDAQLRLDYDGDRWNPQLAVTCRSVSFTYHLFPYRLDRARGKLVLGDDSLNVDLVAETGSREVRITGGISQLSSQSVGWVAIEGTGLPLDEKLLTALPAEASRVARSLRVQGSFNVSARLWRDAGDAASHRWIVVHVRRSAVEPERFPYPLTNISGTIELLDDRWIFHDDLVGTNGAGRVTCAGSIEPTPEGPQLVLAFHGQGVQLDEALHAALDGASQQIWNHLRPRGIVHIDGAIRYPPERDKAGLSLTIRPVGDTASIEPPAFPYRLEHLTGEIAYRDGVAEFYNLRADHGRVRLATNGTARALADDGWGLYLSNLQVERLRPDRELLAALPEALKKAVTDRSPDGTLHVRGSIEVSQSGRAPGTVRAQWDLDFQLHQLGVSCGVRLENIFGGVHWWGSFDERGLLSRGELTVDSVTWNDVQLTEIRGPFFLGEDRLLLGKSVDPNPQYRQRRVSGHVYDGILNLDGQVVLGPRPSYRLDLRVAQADLAQCSRDVTSGRQQLSGKIFADVKLNGRAPGLHNLAGSGSVELREADIYQLPLMVRLLKILGLRRPDTTAFTESQIEFRVDAGHVYFDRIDFKGDAISLFGHGTMDTNRELRLTFRGEVGRGEMRLPLISDLVGGASQQIMQVHVGGTIDAPEVQRNPFPAVNHALQQLQGDLQRPGSPRRNGIGGSFGPPWGGTTLRLR